MRAAPASSAGSIAISEVAPWSSGNSPLAADWFEVTNSTTTSVDITGWRMDDNSNLFASSVLLNGITSIGPGESVIFIETATPAATAAAFRTHWFGANPPAGLQIGSYTGAGVGLGTGGDAVNLYDAAGVLQANVSFGASPTGPTFASFNNVAGLTGAIATLSTVGVNAAFVAFNDADEIGSPGTTLSKLFISEVAPWSSGNSPLGADWFEVTNTMPTAVDITGWKMDDNSNLFANAVALNGITSIGPGQSVIFIETATPATTVAAFSTLWFGANPPAGLQIGSYSGAGVGLGTGGDAVNIYDAGGVLQANVLFGASPVSAPFATFENRAGLTGTISSLSVLGTTGAVAANDASEIGSPGTIGKPAQVVVTPPPSVKINEIESNGGSPADWIELINTGASAADLSGLKLLDSDNTHTKYSIPAGTSLAAGGVLVIDQAQFGFELDAADSVTLFATDGITVIETYAWTQHAVTTYGRCPDGSGALTTTLASSRGAANVCLSSIAAEVWPGGAAVSIADDINIFGDNLSGLTYQASGTNAPGVLWAVRNGPGTLHRLIWDAANNRWTPDPAGWAAGKSLRYTDGSIDPDAEGVTMTDAGAAGGIYVSTERNNANNTVSRPTILRYDVSGSGSALAANLEWNLTADLPTLGANLGVEGLTWIPDSYLVARNFFDEAKGRAYNPADYPTHGTGIFFVGVEANGLIYAYALNTDGSFARVATIVTGFGGVMELHFDRNRGDFWAVCDDTCQGRSELLTINQSTGRFGIAHLFERPVGMPNINNEGFTTAPDFECVNGFKPAFWSDDGNTGGHALRAGTVPCNFTDMTPPTTSAATVPAAPNGQNGWFTSDVGVTLTATDSAGGIGVKEIVYNIGGAPTTVPGATASFSVSTEGSTTVTYFARDNANNAETPKMLALKLDKTAPTTIGSTSPGQAPQGVAESSATGSNGTDRANERVTESPTNGSARPGSTNERITEFPTNGSARPGPTNQRITVSLTATDPAAGSGVKEIVYSASGAQIIAQTTSPGATASFAVVGGTTVSFFARDNAGNVEQTRTLTIDATSGRPEAQLAPELVNFGDVVVATPSANRTVVLANTGLQPLIVTSLAINGPQASDFTIVSPSVGSGSPLTIRAGQTQQIVLRFTPGAAGQRTARLVIADNAPGDRGVTLRGIGKGPEAAISPDRAGFGRVLVGTTAGPRTVTVFNTGLAPLVVSGVTLSGPEASAFTLAGAPTAPTTVASGNSLTFTVNFAPTQRKAYTARIDVSHNGTGELKVPVSGQGVLANDGGGTPPRAEINLTPNQVNFGDAPIGATIGPRTITITNTGDAALTIAGVSAAGDEGDFTLAGVPTSPTQIAPGATLSFTATFKPTVRGQRTLTLTVADNTQGPDERVTLRGVGQGPEMSLSPDGVNFGRQAVGTSQSRGVTVTNTGLAPLHISSITLQGPGMADYSVTPNGASTVAPGATFLLAVTCTPSTTGPRVASLIVNDDAIEGERRVTLSCVGTAGTPGAP
ncbi:MAG: choice-of-anchor D domain-containing protein [Chloroflexota bacterium]